MGKAGVRPGLGVQFPEIRNPHQHPSRTVRQLCPASCPGDSCPQAGIRVFLCRPDVRTFGLYKEVQEHRCLAATQSQFQRHRYLAQSASVVVDHGAELLGIGTVEEDFEFVGSHAGINQRDGVGGVGPGASAL